MEAAMEYKSDIDQEREHLKSTIAVVEQSLAAIIKERAEKAELLKELLTKFTSAAPEFYNDIPITQALVELYTKMIRGYSAASTKPYFGKIIFDSEGGNNILYIGKYGVSDFYKSGAEKPIVVDWRAPVSELYYSTSFGETGYDANGEYIEADVHLKTSFDIEKGSLLGFYDSDVMANDELLIKYLSQNKDSVLTDIVATIQQDQNTIIRLTPYKNVIVQGVAGSGKTTVAIHRISYLLYNFSEALSPENVYVIASGKLFLNYMTSMLPDLDVPEIQQGTLFEFLSDYIQAYDPKFKCTQAANDKAPDIDDVTAIFADINHYFETYETEFYEKEGDAKFFDIEFFSKRAALDYIRSHRRHGILDRSQNLDTFVMDNLYKLKDTIIAYISARKDEPDMQKFCVETLKLDAGFIFEEDVTRHFSRLAAKYKNYYSKELKKLNYLEVYATLRAQKGKSFSTRELAVLSLIVSKMRFNEIERSIRHIVIDEAQDFDLLIYSCIEQIFTNAKFTLVGDVMQSISDSGLQSWDEIRDYVFKGDADFRTLTKSYRNTIEISDFACGLVAEHSDVPLYIEPVIRHGREVCFYPPEDAARQTALLLDQAQENGYNMCAVICADDTAAHRLYNKLKSHCTIKLLDQALGTLEQGNYILSLKDAKGLEFDVVILPDFDAYDLHGIGLRNAYVAITRALHELHVFSAKVHTTQIH